MNLLDLYNMHQKGEITLDEMAKMLDISPKNLKIRISKHGDRLPLVLSVLDKINADQIQREKAAATLDVSVRTMNQPMVSWNVSRPLKDYLVDRAAAQVKWEVRKKYAIDFIGERETLESASEKADVSTRQMRRWVSELIKKHYGIVFRDLKTIPLSRRRMLAAEIEGKEGLELAVRQRVEAIAAGTKALQAEAVERAMDRRERRKRSKSDVRP